jgi:hypothetical protein
MGNIPAHETKGNPGFSKRQDITRRRFLDYLLGTTASATFAAIFYPIIRFMAPPHIVEAMQNSVVAAKLNELPPNSGKIFKFGSQGFAGRAFR